MTFKENINRICKEQGTTLTALVKSMGFGSPAAYVVQYSPRGVHLPQGKEDSRRVRKGSG